MTSRTDSQTEIKLQAESLAKRHKLFDRDNYDSYSCFEPITPNSLGNGAEVTERRYFQSIEYHRRRIHEIARHGGSIGELLGAERDVNNLINSWVENNKGLVYFLVRKVRPPYNEWDNTISEGFMALLRSTQVFNFTKGFKFSTYAYRGIIRTVYGYLKKSVKERPYLLIGINPELSSQSYNDQNLSQDDTEVRIEILKKVLSQDGVLSDREMNIILRRFPLVGMEPETLKEIGTGKNLSRERIRQIQNKALNKLREGIEKKLNVDSALTPANPIRLQL